uniref:Uncharacterized protein n=1 Tax=Arundo donax TaxID=35708 RepID=A0A0A9FLN2_ARUDO
MLIACYIKVFPKKNPKGNDRCHTAAVAASPASTVPPLLSPYPSAA